jgi:hypothetical protein
VAFEVRRWSGLAPGLGFDPEGDAIRLRTLGSLRLWWCIRNAAESDVVSDRTSDCELLTFGVAVIASLANGHIQRIM